MNVSVAFAPSICLPNQVYHALPVLAGALRDAGHVPRCIDLNLAAADMLLTDERVERFLPRGIALERELRAPGDTEPTPLERAEPLLRAAEQMKDVLRDRSRCYDQPLFKRAFWGTDDALRIFYQLDEIVSPFRERFAADVLDHLERDPWSPLRDLWDEGLLDEVLAGEPGLVGICVAFPEQAVEALRLARRVRAARPDVSLCLGGPLLNVHPERWLQPWLFDLVDYVVLGDGAFSIVELVEALEGRGDLDEVRNLVRLRGGAVVRNDPEPWLEPLDDLPLPDFASIDLARFFTPLPIYPLMLSRGCYWGRCTFCSIGWRENYRMLSPASIERHARHLAAQGARYVQMQDSSVPPRGAHLLAETVRAGELGLFWEGGFKFSAQLLDPAWCGDLYAGGCRSLKLGLETMNQSVIDLMEKGFRIESVPAMLRNLREAGISAELLWFIGFPTETLHDVMETVRFLHERRDQFGLTAFVGDYSLHPDTEVFHRPADFGVTVLGQRSESCEYLVERGLQPHETHELKRILACHNNRTLVCNGSHLPHLVESGIDLTGLARPPVVPAELAAHSAG